MQKWEEQIKRAQSGDTKAREKMIMDNVPLVWSMVGRFRYANRDREELFQIGMVGLMQAVDRFNTGYGVQFSTYAVPLIVGEIRRFLREDTPMKITRSIVENKRKIQALQEQNPELSLQKIAELSALSMEDVILALESEQTVESIYETVFDSGESAICLVDKLEQEEKPVEEQIMEQTLLQQAFLGLDDKERQVIQLRFFENKTQTQVGKLLDMSQVQVSRWEKKILVKMRRSVE